MQIETLAPAHDRQGLRPRILHIGFGAFARAHQLVYLDQVLADGGDWGVIACRLNSGVEDLDALDAADGVYHVLEADDQGIVARPIGAVVGSVHPVRDGIAAVTGRIADPALAIISLTITEKGYALKGEGLDADHAGIKADLANPDAPRTAIGVIVAGLRARRDAGQGGLTVMSCDNLPHNGRLARAAVLDYARLLDADLAAWIEGDVRFPATMVDRIVPALNDKALALIEQATGRADANSILTEPFRQWVIEDDFAAGRPAFEDAGAQMVQDVAPFEEMKLRMLNGSHTFLACLGQLAGCETVSDCMDDPVLRDAARRLMLTEQAPTLRPLPGVDIADYADQLIARFGNSTLQHRTAQIATDTSAKLPQRLVAPAAAHLAADRGWPLTALAIAGWMRLVRQTVDGGGKPTDPMADRLAQVVADTQDGGDYVTAMLALTQVFPVELASDPRFAAPIASAYLNIVRTGARTAIANAMGAA